MAPEPPQGLTPATLISAKGTELKFWIVKANETAEKKVMNLSGTVDTLRKNIAAYYGFDLTVNPRAEVVAAPTLDESIRDRQWADLEALGAEWRQTVNAGGTFKLLDSKPLPASNTMILSMSQIEGATVKRADGGIPRSAEHADKSEIPETQSHTSSAPPLPHAIPQLPVPTSAIDNTNNQIASTSSNPPLVDTPIAAATSAAARDSEAALLDDLSTTIAGLERCAGLRDVIRQIESGAVQAIRDRYGPSEVGRRGTAHESWPRYSNLVSKRERLDRVLKQDFGGNKEVFFAFFTVPPPASKKRKRPVDEPITSEEHFRSFRKIVEAIPWRDDDITSERRKAEYLGSDGKFDDGRWIERWGTKNSWEVWREIGKERYVKGPKVV
ncbi:hypothetical protein C8R46DRAFT_1233343 [Mycena filopes]|nr:hypothetical protein C8R46DRAFT_1233343 [Mycena filopes]